MEKFKELKFTSWCIRNRTALYVFTTLMMLAGGYAFTIIPKEHFPDVVVPTISVITIYPGNTPGDIENLITKPIETQLKSINGIKKIQSNSISDVSIITAEFDVSTRVDLAKQKVKDAVDKAKNELPSDLKDDPQIKEFDISELPIMNINLAGDLPLDKLKKYAKDLEDKIETLSEITRVDVVGGLDREVQVYVDMYKMQQASVSFSDIEAAIVRANLNITSGEIRIGDLRRNVRVTGQFSDPKEIESLVIRSFTGNLVYLRDFATVVDGYKEKQDFARLNQQPVITLNVIKRSGENLIAASDKIRDIIKEYQATKFPDGLKVTITGDQSESTRTNLHELFNTLIIGFILVLMLLAFFMGLKSAFFVALAGPLSMAIAFMIMPGIDFTLNIVVLFSFLLALGIIVDDAIVVIENTHRILHKYDFGIEKSASYAAGSVFIPVLSGTLTTLGPFFPLLFWPGTIGSFMKFLPVTLILTLGASLLVAFVINPVFAVSFMKRDEHHEKPKIKDMIRIEIALGLIAIIGYTWLGNGLGNLMVLFMILTVLYHFVFYKVLFSFQDKIWPKAIILYKKILAHITKGARPAWVVFGTFLLLIFSIVLIKFNPPKILFFPSPDPNYVYVYCEMPMGTDAEVTDSVTRIIEKRVYEVMGEHNPNVKSVISNIGLNAGDPMNPDRVPTPYKSKVSIAFVNFSEREKGFSSVKCLEDIRKKFEVGIPGAVITVDKERSGPPTGKPINIEVSGDDFDVLQNIVSELKQRIDHEKIDGIEELTSDLRVNKPEIILQLDQEKAQREGVSLAQVGMELRTALYGKEVSKYKDVNDDAPIMLRAKQDFRNSVEQLMNVQIQFMDMASGRFKQLPISTIASIKYNESFSSINRKNQKRMVTLSSNLTETGNANEINALIASIVSDMSIPEGYEISLTGEQEKQKETSDFLGVAFMIALALMFLIMVLQFNSTIKPLMMFATVLFSLIGVFMGLAIFNMTLSIVMTGVGIFAMSGIVIRNGILMIEFIDELRKNGFNVIDAAVEAGTIRMTPVLLTAVATICGLIPLAVGMNIDFVTLFTELNPHIHFGGDNVAFWGPLAWTMIFGLTVATVLTLLVVPSMYIMAYNFKHRFLVRKVKTV
ncbi:MAG: efflux RND transporter permease subunit [Flavobacteriales bacterium]|nr:efflux RND transporter permease subunit [Flavobacteriales bacterium]